MNQVIGSAYMGDIPYFIRVLLFIAFLSMGYELSRPRPAGNKEQVNLLSETGVISKDKEWTDLPSWQRKASKKAIERYASVQDKKWRRWNEAMFERSS